ncbi:hypothetical protein KW805_01850 [Candidatus Pacearchaeota archaeon]|nr:hypothetical protein [Candidatus Pacearchaeota archaeon]
MNVKNIVLGIGIFIVYMLMLGYGIEAFYPSPKYDSYCTGSEFTSPKYPYAVIPTNCSYSPELQQQEQACYASQGMPVYQYNNQGCTISATCNYCNKQFNDAQKEYSKGVFIVALIAGIITLIIGYTILSVEPVGSALMASGIGAIFYGSVRNWSNLSDIWRFLLLLVALVVLIWIALRINRNLHHKRR